MKEIRVSTRSQWRAWLSENHGKEPAGVWVVFFRKDSGKPSLGYEECVEEALCFGWIDSIIKRIDDDTYCRKFTPRKDASSWSSLNKRRVEKLIKEGRITEFGLAKVEAARQSGRWDTNARPPIPAGLPQEFSDALTRNRKAKECFENLAPSCQRQYIGWIATAKRPETKTRRLKEALVMLGKGKKLGLK